MIESENRRLKFENSRLRLIIARQADELSRFRSTLVMIKSALVDASTSVNIADNTVDLVLAGGTNGDLLMLSQIERHDYAFEPTAAVAAEAEPLFDVSTQRNASDPHGTGDRELFSVSDLEGASRTSVVNVDVNIVRPSQ